MVDVDPFLTTLYVMADDFCKPSLPPEPHPGPQAALRQSEVVTVAMFGQWQNFGSERGFYRYAQRHLRAAFPSLPTRDAKRRGAGWLPGLADSGWSNRLGWYAGFHVLLAVPPWGMITGFGFGPASTKDQPLAETFFALRRSPHPGLASVGLPACGPYVVDKGFEGHANHQPWWRAYGAQVICPPKRNSRVPWPKGLRRWLAGIRQIVETVYDKLWHTFRLDRERPPDLRGFQARLAAKIALHNFCLWLHEQLGRPRLAFADLVAW